MEMQIQSNRMAEARKVGCAINKTMIPGYNWLIIAFALLISIPGTIPVARADIYPASVQWAYYHNGWHEWYTSADEAAQAAFTAWTPPAYIKNPVKLDWFFGGCSSKSFIDRGQGQFNYVHVLLSTTSSVNGLWCENTGIALSYYYYCPNGGELSNFPAGQCVNAPPCQAPLTRDPKTGACVQTCQPPDVIDPATGQCVHCPIKRLPDLPENDACTRSLEAGRGKDVNKACPAMTKEMQDQAQCLADKIHRLGIPYTEPSATIRTEAYQNHLLAVWNKSEEIKKKVRSDAQKQACAAIVANVNNEKDNIHGLDSNPSSKGNQAPHVLGRAVDVPRNVALAMMRQVTETTFVTVPNCLFCIPFTVTTIGDVQGYVNSATVYPPACSLVWGGRFAPVDRVHFQLP